MPGSLSSVSLRHIPIVLLLGFSLAACDKQKTAPSTTASSSSSSVAVSSSTTSATNAGTATISGSVNGIEFRSAASAIWIGVPDDPSTMAIYVSEKPLSCADMAKKGWVRTVAADQHVFEMIPTGKTAQSYKPSTSKDVPPPGEVEVNFVVTGPTKNETRATGGSVDITTIVANTSISGTFDCTFPNGKLSGAFTATYCPDAHEP